LSSFSCSHFEKLILHLERRRERGCRPAFEAAAGGMQDSQASRLSTCS